MNATRIQINGLNVTALLLAVVVTAAAFLAANPELVVARRYTTAPVVAWLAANPELMVARRYTAAVQAGAQAATLAANPELSSARHYVPYHIANQAALASLLAANPELMVARRHIALENRVDPNSDIGLLEFFRPQTTKEVNPPDSRQNKVDPDSDIGLLEFSKPQTKEVSTPNHRFVPPGGWTRQHLDDY